MHLLTYETPDFITPALWPANSPDLNSVDYHLGEAAEACVARFVPSISWSRAWWKSGNISTRWSSIKRSGSGVHVLELAFDFEHTVDILNTDFRYADVLPFARTHTWLWITHVPIGHLCIWVTLLNLLYLLQVLTNLTEIWWLVCHLTSQCWRRISLNSDVVCQSYGNVYRVTVFFVYTV